MLPPDATALSGRPLPLARRAPRDELELTRVQLQVFLLLRHSRNVLLGYRDDVRPESDEGDEGEATPEPGATVRVGRAAQLIPCELQLPGQPRIASCRLVLRALPKPAATSPRLGDAPACASPPGSPTCAAASPPASPSAAAPASLDWRHLVLVRQPSERAQLALALPLAAVSISMVPATGATVGASPGSAGKVLAVAVAKQHAPPGVGAERPIELHFPEPRWCADAKAYTDAACAAVRHEQMRRLVEMLRPEVHVGHARPAAAPPPTKLTPPVSPRRRPSDEPDQEKVTAAEMMREFLR